MRRYPTSTSGTTSSRFMLAGRTCTVMIDGFETKPFKIERGLPQGDTTSLYLFVLEMLLLRIMLDNNVTKIKLTP
jgi:hypothetical protein